jgi:hypothetical protein
LSSRSQTCPETGSGSRWVGSTAKQTTLAATEALR